MAHATAVRSLLSRCARSHEPEAWEVFVERFQPGIERAVRGAIRGVGRRPDRDLVAELVQEVYCRLLANGRRRIAACRGASEAEVGGFLARTARNVVVDHFRAAWAGKRGSGRVRPVAEAGGGADSPVDPTADPEARLLARERLRDLLRRCSRLASARRRHRDLRILTLALVAGMSSREISRALGGELAPSSVDSVLCRLRRRLRAEGVGLRRR